MAPNSTMFALKLRSCVILSVDSRVTENMFGRVVDNAYNKLIQLHPRVFLGCLGDPEVCEALRQNLPTAEFTPTSVFQGADLVKTLINNYVENFPDAAAEVFVVGSLPLVDDKEDFKIYKISKEKGHSWKHGVEEVVEQVAMGGTGGRRVLKTYVENNVFNPDMTEEEGIMYALEGIKCGVENDWCTGGEIQVVAINLDGGFKRRKWRQNNPGSCVDEYHLVAHSASASDAD